MRQIQALVVDDSLSMRRSIRQALQRIAGLICTEAQDGMEAIKKFAHSRYDVVVTDINMPMMDGLKLISHIRHDPSHAALPIVVITTEASPEDRAKAMALGASAYLVKPVQAKLVIDTVAELLQLS